MSATKTSYRFVSMFHVLQDHQPEIWKMYGSSIHEMVTVIGLTYWIIHTSCMHADQEANLPLYAEIPY